MSRRNAAVKKPVLPDPKFNNELVTKVVNQIMKSGKKGLAQKIVYSAMDFAAEKTNLESMEALNTAIENIKPILEVKARRVGGATYQVPIEIRAERRQTLAIRWLVDFARKRSERTMELKLGNEIVDAINSTGGAVKRKDEMHRAAEANKAFAHYRW